MEIRKNAGYTITDSVHVGNAEFVIGEFPGAPAPFVTWECKDGDNYFWGHYLSSRQNAERDLLERAGLERERLDNRQKQAEKQKDKECER
ncbi:MAG: hypothetical protein PHR14_10005 [Oscillospiraceae bacterium]|nr:hypothetical protein [Oscillospiraceae bacterium]